MTSVASRASSPRSASARIDAATSSIAEIDAVRAPVGRIGAPLDESRARELVDQPRERDRLHLERFGQVHLTHALAPGDVHERACLRHRQRAALLSLPVRAAHQARNVGDEESEVAGLPLHRQFI
jgi:hypothetical protein